MAKCFFVLWDQPNGECGEVVATSAIKPGCLHDAWDTLLGFVQELREMADVTNVRYGAKYD